LFEPLPVQRLTGDYYFRGQHELSNDVCVSSVASFIGELEFFEV